MGVGTKQGHIGQYRLAAKKQDVVGLDVAMHETGIGQGLRRRADWGEPGGDFAGGKPSGSVALPRDVTGQGARLPCCIFGRYGGIFAIGEWHDVENLSFDETHVVYAHQAGFTTGEGKLLVSFDRFQFENAALGGALIEHLESDGGVGGLGVGEPHGAEASLTDGADQAVAVDALAGVQRGHEWFVAFGVATDKGGQRVAGKISA